MQEVYCQGTCGYDTEYVKRQRMQTVIITPDTATSDAVPPPMRAGPTTGSVVAIGNFDGCHLGHQNVIRHAVRRAQELGVSTTVLTFSPHPRAVLRPEEAFLPLMTPHQKQAALAALGVDQLCILPFTPTLAAQSAEEFVHRLQKLLRPAALFVGYNFCFGQARGGTVASLQRLFPSTTIVPATTGPEGTPCSTSQIKALLAQGDIAAATALLGHPFATSGVVVLGAQRGRTLGFPTANLQLEPTSLPKPGVYAVNVELPNGASVHTGVANLGTRPTFSGQTLGMEVHILNFSGDLYGQTLTVRWIARLRDEQKFDSLEALRQQIQQDCRQAQRLEVQKNPHKLP
jgi:riboflavin kinase/FMN adenylyltransferase